MRRPITPVEFRLRPENRSLYCQVRVWPDHAAMLDHLEFSEGKMVRAACVHMVAICTGVIAGRFVGGKRRISGLFAEIDCHRKRLDSDVVVHETTHAALRWAARIGLNPTMQGTGGNVSPEEERFVRAVGRMAAQFNDALHARGLWKSA